MGIEENRRDRSVHLYGNIRRARLDRMATKRGTPSDNVQKMMDRKVDFTPKPGQVGTCLDLHEKLALDLAREFQRQESGDDYVMITWANQQKAQDYFNTHGFIPTLDYMCSLQDENDRRLDLFLWILTFPGSSRDHGNHESPPPL